MKNMIEYQEIDKKLRGMELELKGSEERKRAKLAQGFLTKVDEVAARLDKRAQDLTAQYNDIGTVYEQKLKEVKDFRGVAEGLEEHKEIDYIAKKVEKTMNEVRRLEAEAAELSREIETTLAEFSELKKKIKFAKEEYQVNRAKYEDMKKAKAPEMEKLRAQLVQFEKNVDKDLLAKYKKKREEKIFPVFVRATADNMCGGCRMEIPLAARNQLASNKLIECEECKRYIYKD